MAQVSSSESEIGEAQASVTVMKTWYKERIKVCTCDGLTKAVSTLLCVMVVSL